MKMIGQSVVFVIGVSLVMGGCVSSKKYRKLEAEKQVLQSQFDAIDDSNLGLTQQLMNSESETEKLAREKAELEKKTESMAKGYQNLVQSLNKEVTAGNLKIQQYQNMLKVDVASQVFFKSGSARLKKDGKDVLIKVGETLAMYPEKMVRVIGHTDNIRVSKKLQAVFPTNWELSVLRATNVVRVLQEDAGVAPERLAAVGRGEFEPIAPNDTPEGRSNNRRIEILLFDKEVFKELDNQKQ